MDTQILKDMIAVFRTEQERRASLLNAEDTNFAYDQWLFTDEPFLNELCLMFLVTLRHQVERELVGLAARADDDGKEISDEQYWDKVISLGKEKNIGLKWEKINKRLNLKSCEKYKFNEALRLLSNLCKHDPSMEPDDKLLELLQLKKVAYAPLPESDSFRKGLAGFIGLKKDADYCDIAERFVDIASEFLAEVKRGTNLSKVNLEPTSLNPKDFKL